MTVKTGWVLAVSCSSTWYMLYIMKCTLIQSVLQVSKSFESESEVAQSHPTLCDPMNCSSPGSSIHGILSRQESWSGGAISFSGGSSRARDQIQVSWTADSFLYLLSHQCVDLYSNDKKIQHIYVDSFKHLKVKHCILCLLPCFLALYSVLMKEICNHLEKFVQVDKSYVISLWRRAYNKF